jgi:hypothetical protein
MNNDNIKLTIKNSISGDNRLINTIKLARSNEPCDANIEITARHNNEN